MNKVIIADDIDMNREILADFLQEKYTIINASNGIEALEALEREKNNVSLLLLDLIMPEMDGIEVLKKLNEKSISNKVPVLVITAEDDPKIERMCLALGAVDFIRKPFNFDIVQQRIRLAIELYEYKNGLEKKIEEQTIQLRLQNVKLLKQNKELQEMNEKTINLLANVVEGRDENSGQHVKRVVYYTKQIATCLTKNFPEYDLSDEIIDSMASASALHDLGKIMIPDSILLKPGKLTADEFELMKKHTIRGCELLEKDTNLWNKKYYSLCYNICRFHHEKWNGQGYPDKLSGDNIPIEAQIVSIADCFDALTTDRPYKKAFSCDVAFDMINNGDCGSFNPKILISFNKLKEEFSKLLSL